MKATPRYTPGDKIAGRYHVHDVKMGGMGEVYLCLDLKEMYPYALKTFQQRYLNQSLRAAFEQEVATWVALEKHPNIVRCFWMQILDNQPFMQLEWIAGHEYKGSDLRSWLRHGPLDTRHALEVAIDICRGLIHAQEKQPGFVHRDLKPENILMMQGGQAKITDFGLAAVMQKSEAKANVAVEDEFLSNPDNRTGTVSIANPKSKIGNPIVGTPPYMPPEQWRGEPLDERTDIYALGCILYELLTGEMAIVPRRDKNLPPLLGEGRGGDIMMARWQHAHETQPPQLSTVNCKLLTPVIHQCLQKQPAQRYPNVESLLTDLTNLYQQIFNQPPPSHSESTEFTAGDYNNRGSTYGEIGRHEEALADYAQAIVLSPNYAETYLNRGVTYHNMGRHEEALANYAQAIVLNPNYTDAYNNRGVTYKNIGRNEKALVDYAQAIVLNPNYADAYNNRGSTYGEIGRHEEALADYAQAIVLNPNDAMVYNNRGVTYKNMGRHEEALADYVQAIVLNPNDAMAYNNRGLTYHDMGRYEEALADYAQAIVLNPNYADAYLNRGNTYGEIGRHEEALANSAQAIVLNPNDAMAYNNRGNACYNMGRHKEALADYAQAIVLNPNYANAYFNMGVLYYNREDKEAALPCFKQAAKLGVEQAVGLVTRIQQELGQSPSTGSTDGQANPIQAFDAFLAADTAEGMVQAVKQYPIMTRLEFVVAVEDVLKQVPPEQQPALQQKLDLLKQLIAEQE
ncbi:tetratricopeptide repeat protein [Anaerolineales bacterium HSG25]|nr:tetratricopeptide repeat protein [Anaerolineales bacterium HSG25]